MVPGSTADTSPRDASDTAGRGVGVRRDGADEAADADGAAADAADAPVPGAGDAGDGPTGPEAPEGTGPAGGGGGAGRRTPRRILLAAAAAVTVASLVVVALVVTGVVGKDRTVRGEEAVEGLVAAWERYRMGTFAVESEWRRTMVADERTLYSATFLAQRPPDRIQRQHGAVRGQVDGSPIYCGTEPDGDYRCTPAARPAPDYRTTVDGELEAWRSYVAGPVPLYEITSDGGECFELRLLRVEYADPPYGLAAELCFDEATGALRYLRRELPTAVEEQEAIEIRTEVTPLDFELTQDDAYLGEPEIPVEDLLGSDAPDETEPGDAEGQGG